MIIGSVVASLVLLKPAYAAFSHWRAVRPYRGRLLLPLLRRNGKWAMLHQASTKITSQLQPWFIKFFIGTEAVAIFSVAKSLVGIIFNLFPKRTLQTLVPLFITDRRRAQRVYIAATKYLLLVSCIAGGFAFAVTGPFINFFFPHYSVSLPYYYVLLFTLPISALSVVASIFLNALRRQKFLFYQHILTVAVGIPAYFLLLPVLGLWGLVVHTLALSLIAFLQVYYYLLKYHPGISLRFKQLFTINETDRAFWRLSLKQLRGIFARKQVTPG